MSTTANCVICSLAEFAPPSTLSLSSVSLTGGTPSITAETLQCNEECDTPADCSGTLGSEVCHASSYDILHDNGLLPILEAALNGVQLDLHNSTGSSGSNPAQWGNVCTANYWFPATQTAPEYTTSETPTGTIQHAYPISPIGTTDWTPVRYAIEVGDGVCCKFDDLLSRAIDGYVISGNGVGSDVLTISATAICPNTWNLSVAGSLTIYQRVQSRELTLVGNACDDLDTAWSIFTRGFTVSFSGSAIVNDLSNVNLMTELLNLPLSFDPSGDLPWAIVEPCGIQIDRTWTFCTKIGAITICAETAMVGTSDYTYDQPYAKIAGGSLVVS